MKAEVRSQKSEVSLLATLRGMDLDQLAVLEKELAAREMEIYLNLASARKVVTALDEDWSRAWGTWAVVKSLCRENNEEVK